MKKIVVLDYDGVILDSLNEKFFIGYNAYANITELNIGTINFHQFETKFLKNDSYNAFRDMISFIGIAGENACAIALIKAGIYPKTKEQFLKEISKLNKEFYHQCHEEVLRLRAYYGIHNSREYNELCPPFQAIVKLIKKYSKKIHFEICTTKPLENVIYFNKQFELQDCFKDIYVVDDGETKVDRLHEIHHLYSIDKKNILFVDDVLINLELPFNEGFTCYHATWGFGKNKIKNIKSVTTDELEYIFSEL